MSTFNWNLKEVLLLHTSETPRMSSKPLCEAAALSAFLFSFPSICRSFLISQLERGRVGGALLGFFSHCILMMSTSSWRNRCFQSWRKICKTVRERHLNLWNSLTCYSETLWVEKEGNHYLPVTHPPAHFPHVYSPESADFSLSLHKGRNAGKKLDYTLPSRLTCWFLSGIIEVLDNRLFHASVGERCLQKTYHSIKRVNLSHLFLGPVLTPHHVSLFHQM